MDIETHEPCGAVLQLGQPHYIYASQTNDIGSQCCDSWYCPNCQCFIYECSQGDQIIFRHESEEC